MRADELHLGSLLTDAGTIVWNAKHDAIELDDPASRMLGLAKQGLERGIASLLRVVSEGSRDALAGAMEASITDGSIFDIAIEVDHEERTRHLGLRGTVVMDASGDLDRLVIGVRDQTELVAARAQAAAIGAQMRERDQHHATELAALEATARDKAQLVGGLSREIRTRLGAVLGMGRLLLDGALTVEQREQVRSITDAGTDLLAFTSDVVDVAIDDPSGEPDLVVASIQELLATTIAASVELAAERKLTVSCQLAPELPEAIRVDATRLARVLHHVLSSALATASASEIVVSVKTTRVASTLHDLTIVIADAATAPAKDPLALLVAARLVRRLGGKLGVAFTPSTRVTIELSVDEASFAPATPIAIDPAMGTKHPLSILVAEDNPINRRIADVFLNKLGYTARHAVNGREAVEQVERERFDVVFMDIMMPELDGLEATRIIHQRHQSRRPRIVALTANALPSDRAACLRAGCDDYLTKPFTIEGLARALATVPVRKPTSVDEPEHVDNRKLAALEVALGPQLFTDILAAHEADARELVLNLERALLREDVTALLRNSLALMATCSVLGAGTLNETAQFIHRACELGDLVTARSHVTRAVRELGAVLHAIGRGIGQAG